MTKTAHGAYKTRETVYIPIGEIYLSVYNPRIKCDTAGIDELARSISRYGILQPLSVKKREGGGFELISGARRLRAASIAGLGEVPCVIIKASEPASAIISLVENIQRRDVDFIDEARAIARLISSYGLTQTEAAKYLGRSQSAVANKLRILNLPPDVLCDVRRFDLTERHARALLRLSSRDDMMRAVSNIVSQKLNVADTEAYIDELLNAKKSTPKLILKDVGMLVNSIRRAASMVDGAEVEVSDDAIIVKLRRE